MKSMTMTFEELPTAELKALAAKLNEHPDRYTYRITLDDFGGGYLAVSEKEV